MAGLTVSKLYLSVTGITCRKGTNAPLRNLSRHKLLDVVPSGKMSVGGKVPSSSLSFARSTSTSRVLLSSVFDPDLGMKTQPKSLQIPPRIGTFFMKDPAANVILPLKVVARAWISKQDTWGAIMVEMIPPLLGGLYSSL